MKKKKKFYETPDIQELEFAMFQCEVGGSQAIDTDDEDGGR